jgi:molybdenum cofactor cytidylyltransferase
MNKTIKRNPKIALIILAAGSSKRMKAVKQLLPWRNTTLLEHVIETGVNSNVNDVFVVLGANYKNIEEQIDSANVTLINNPRWEEGMGTSISCSLAYLSTKSLIFDAVLIALCDQPLIDVTYFNKLINNFIDKNINIVSSNLGVPAIFGLKYFKSLTELDQDIGARKIISSNKDDLFVVQEEKKLVDIDTEKDYNELFRKYGKL